MLRAYCPDIYIYTVSTGELLDETTGQCRIITCTDGYEADDRGHCYDIDECQKGIDDCPPDSDCQNIEGSYDCVRSSTTYLQFYIQGADASQFFQGRVAK